MKKYPIVLLIFLTGITAIVLSLPFIIMRMAWSFSKEGEDAFWDYVNKDLKE